MSEYQYYEFQAIDRSLTDRQMRELRAISSRAEIDRWIAALDDHDKVSLLGRVARGEAGVGAELMRRFRRQTTRREPSRTLRTAGALRVRTAELADQRRARILAREARERARCEREQAAGRDRHLNQLAKRQADAWRRVETLDRHQAPDGLRRCRYAAPGFARDRRAERTRS
jgi:hypothetical protein